MRGGGGHVVNVLSEELRPVAPRVGFDDDDALDASLVSAAQAGDLHAFARLYDRHHERLVRFCRSRLGNADDAADAAQETFLRAWRSLDTFGRRGSVYPWLHAIARNVCTDTLRKRLRVDTSDDRALGSLPDTGLSALDRLDIEVDNAVLRAALDRLSDRHREILSLREYEGWSYERIADAEHLELNAVKSLVWRARQALRREFLLLDTDGGRFGGFLGLGLLLRRALPSARRAVDRVAFAAGELTAAGHSAATSVGVAAASAVGVTAIAVGVSVAPTPPPPPAPAPIVATAVISHTSSASAPDGSSAGPTTDEGATSDDAASSNEGATDDDASTPTAPTTDDAPAATTPSTSPRAEHGPRDTAPTAGAPAAAPSSSRTLLVATSPTTVAADQSAKAPGARAAGKDKAEDLATTEATGTTSKSSDKGNSDQSNGNAGGNSSKASTSAETTAPNLKGNGNAGGNDGGNGNADKGNADKGNGKKK
jgi:RNA polymerase sigma factor (sigma-70 family)